MYKRSGMKQLTQMFSGVYHDQRGQCGATTETHLI